MMLGYESTAQSRSTTCLAYWLGPGSLSRVGRSADICVYLTVRRLRGSRGGLGRGPSMGRFLSIRNGPTFRLQAQDWDLHKDSSTTRWNCRRVRFIPKMALGVAALLPDSIGPKNRSSNNRALTSSRE
jgi:hypothetical protein